MSFVNVARSTDVPPGEARVYDAGGTPVAIFNVGGELHACKNVCPHRGGPVGEGDFDGQHVTCPWHGWHFDVVSGQETRMPAARLEKLAVRVEGEFIQIDLG